MPEALKPEAWQDGFNPNDIQYRSMKAPSKAARFAIFPDSPIHCVDLTVGIVSPTFRFYCILSNIGNIVSYSHIFCNIVKPCF